MMKHVDGDIRVFFDTCDKVYLKLRPYRQKTLTRRNEKLSPSYFGSYEIVKRIEAMPYRLKLHSSSSLHLVFHVFQLRRAIGDLIPSSLISSLMDDMEVTLEPM